jgi:hypothetical protein
MPHLNEWRKLKIRVYIAWLLFNEVWNRVTYDYLGKNLSGFAPLNRTVFGLCKFAATQKNGLMIDAG